MPAVDVAGLVVGSLIVLLNLAVIVVWLMPYDDSFRRGGPGSPVRPK